MQQRVLEIIQENEGKGAKLLAILHDIQDEFGYIPREAMEILAEKLGKKPGEIYDAASFYSFFTFKPARHIIRVCNGIVCNLKGSEKIIKAIEEHYGIRDGEVTEDGNFIPFHFAESAANALTIDALDPEAKIPELKVAAVKLKKC